MQSNSTPKTVFVIGAGASKEVGLPVGYDLKNHIERLISFKVLNDYQRTPRWDNEEIAFAVRQLILTLK